MLTRSPVHVCLLWSTVSADAGDKVKLAPEKLASDQGCSCTNCTEDIVKRAVTKAGLQWTWQMRKMLGKTFTVLGLAPRSTNAGEQLFALPSLDGSDGGAWFFPPSVLTKGKHAHTYS